MISDNEMDMLLRKIDENTKNGKIEWYQIDTHSYRCSFPRSSVVTSHLPNRGGYGISVLNSSGEEVGHLDVESSSADQDQIMERIYKSAERKALSIDETLDDILSNLE